MNGKPSVSRDAQSTHVTFYQQQVGVRLARTKEHIRRYGASKADGSNDTKLSFSILQSLNSETARISWQDDDKGRLESRITEIVVELILTAEIQHRESAIQRYQWRVKRKAELEEEERKRKLEAERRERERLKPLEQGRIDRLLKDAAAFRQAEVIRNYVQAVRLVPPCDSSTEAIEGWSSWTLAQADRIDPAIGGSFLKSMQDEDEI
jgi:hypothetical protein